MLRDIKKCVQDHIVSKLGVWNSHQTARLQNCQSLFSTPYTPKDFSKPPFYQMKVEIIIAFAL